MKTIFILMTMCMVLTGTSMAQAQSLETLLGHLSPAPDILNVQKRALIAANLYSINRPIARMRLSNLVPQLDLEVGWTQQTDEESRYREDLNTLDGGQLNRDFIRQDAMHTLDTRRTIRIRAKFDLSKLVFDPRELQWHRLERQIKKDQQLLINTVSQLYWQRQMHQLNILLTPRDDLEAMVQHYIKIQLITAQLDGLTGGWFRRALVKHNKRTKKGGQTQ